MVRKRLPQPSFTSLPLPRRCTSSVSARALQHCCSSSDLGYNNIGYHNHVTKSPHIDEHFSTGLELNHSFSHKWWCDARS